MRVIIIEDKDAKSLLEKLELQAMRKNNIMRADYNRPPEPTSLRSLPGKSDP